MASVLLPGAAMAATTVKVNRNGADSVNVAKVSNKSYSKVEQTNNTVVNTGVFANANTGGNKVKKNTGGSSTVNTGAASNTVDVAVTGNTNTADTDCGCPDSDTNVSIRRNGADSFNKVEVYNNSIHKVEQTNNTVVNTVVGVNANTGHNTVSKNTDGGSSVGTGAANNTVGVLVEGGSNSN